MKDMHVIFEEIPHLLQALYTTGGNKPFPATVKQIQESSLAVPLQHFGFSESNFDHLSSQYGWQANIVTEKKLPSNDEVQLADIIDRVWQYSDPLRLEQTEMSRSYILGAQNSKQAQYLLKYLTGCNTKNISARPIILSDRKEISFLWEITVLTEDMSTPPPLFLLQKAKRTWWRTVELYHQQVKLFVEWPYQWPGNYLSQLDWGKNAIIVLISRHKPPIVVRIPDETPTFHELIDVADVQVGKRHTISVSPAPIDNLNFRVDLKLVPNPDPRQVYEDRINELTLEIDAKQALRKWIQEQQSEYIETSDLVPEPLFLYANNKIPFELRRLLIEWADQEELRSLQYQKIKGQSLPEGIMPVNTDVHVLTTEAALKTGILNSVGLQLRDYTPSGGGGFTRFELLPEWAEFCCLRLFIPQGKQLELYPLLKPSPVAAKKLARALLPKNARIQDWIVLLIPADNNQLHVCQLPAKFSPLIEEFDWQCNLQVPVSRPGILQPIVEETRERFITSIEKLFSTALKKQIKTRLKTAKDKLVARLNRISDALRKREDNVSSCENNLSQIDNQLVKVSKVLNRLESELNGLVTNLSQISQNTTQIQNTLGNLKSVTAQIDENIYFLNALKAEARHDL